MLVLIMSSPQTMVFRSLHTDVNECATNNGGCDQTCKNNVGTFACSCQSGYTLAINGLSCNGMYRLC